MYSGQPYYSPFNRTHAAAAAVAVVGKPDNGFMSVLSLAYALTKDAILSSSSSGSNSRPGAAQQPLQGLAGPGFDGSTPGPTATALLEVAGKGRALGTLSAILSGVTFDLEAEDEHRYVWMWMRLCIFVRISLFLCVSVCADVCLFMFLSVCAKRVLRVDILILSLFKPCNCLQDC